MMILTATYSSEVAHGTQLCEGTTNITLMGPNFDFHHYIMQLPENVCMYHNSMNVNEVVISV